jgi:hypothetical protein
LILGSHGQRILFPYDVFKSSLEEFQAAVRDAGLEDKVHYMHHGETYNFQIQTLKDRSSVSGQAA